MAWRECSKIWQSWKGVATWNVELKKHHEHAFLFILNYMATVWLEPNSILMHFSLVNVLLSMCFTLAVPLLLHHLASFRPRIYNTFFRVILSFFPKPTKCRADRKSFVLSGVRGKCRDVLWKALAGKLEIPKRIHYYYDFSSCSPTHTHSLNNKCILSQALRPCLMPTIHPPRTRTLIGYGGWHSDH